jgi:KUP system potassium uptake protein
VEKGTGTGERVGGGLGIQLAALGVVFGDIGTSPLYAMRECLKGPHAVPVTHGNVMGVLSLVVWALMLVVTFKYLTVVMRASNHGEGGLFALLALVPERLRKTAAGRLGWPALFVLFGAGLLYGDGMITPAISVLSAVEGLETVEPRLAPLVVPLTCVVLLGLFALQRRGTGSVGKLFGPVMVLWFVTIGVAGALGVMRHPQVLGAVNPVHAVRYFQAHGLPGALVLGSVVLAVTGGEALYADMGHFGARPIRRAWMALVLPALLLSYMGQGALLLVRPADVANPFFSLVPGGAWTLALVLLSTAATIIASQALISGAFSMTHQAIQLGYLPAFTVRHTSREHEGQIYVPEVNALLAVACVVLVLTFRHSSRLASAYGLAVTGTMTVTSLVFFAVARHTWRWPAWKAVPLLLLFLSFDLPFVGANLFKLLDGGFIPVLVGLMFFAFMKTWKRGRELYGAHQRATGGQVDVGAFVRSCDTAASRPAGTGIFLTGQEQGVPPALLRLVDTLHVVPQTAVLLTIRVCHEAHVAQPEPKLEALGSGVHRASLEFGFMDYLKVPEAVRLMAQHHGIPADPAAATYFAERDTFETKSGDGGGMSRWSQWLFAFVSRNARPVTERLSLPPERVVEIGARVPL